MPHSTQFGHGFIHLKMNDVTKGVAELDAEKAAARRPNEAWIAQFSHMQNGGHTGGAGDEVLVEAETDQMRASPAAHAQVQALVNRLAAKKIQGTNQALYQIMNHWCCFTDH